MVLSLSFPNKLLYYQSVCIVCIWVLYLRLHTPFSFQNVLEDNPLEMHHLVFKGVLTSCDQSPPGRTPDFEANLT